jgi:hypothetical protein
MIRDYIPLIFGHYLIEHVNTTFNKQIIDKRHATKLCIMLSFT